MGEVSDDALRKACYTTAEAAMLFVNNYPNQDKELVDMADKIVIEFLSDLEQQLYYPHFPPHFATRLH